LLHHLIPTLHQISNMKPKLILFVLIAGITFRASAVPPVEEGKAIFTSRCASCHNVNKLVVGPALAGVDQRHSIDWIINFVQSSQTVIKSGDKKANELFAKFNNIPMPDHKDLSAESIKSVVEYIKTSAVEETKTVFRPEKIRPAYMPLSIKDYGFFSAFLGLVVLMIASMVVLVRVKEQQRLKSEK
jgi:mono/diheme cytochrome c family protein